MSDSSNIEWTDATWNPVVGCTRVNRDCDHCYAVTMTHRLEAMGQPRYAGLTVLNPKGDRHFNGTVRTIPEALEKPLSWKKPRRIFVNSMSDLFHRDVPDDFIRLVFAVMSYCGQHTFQILTKRPARAAAWFADEANSLSACQAEYCIRFACDDPAMTPTGRSRVRDTRAINGHRKGLGDGNYWPLPNVWIGTSCGHQEAADEMIPHLLRCPAAVRFLSCEPLTGPVDLSAIPHSCGSASILDRCCRACDAEGPSIDWVIAGGESGPAARPSNIGWHRLLRDQCANAGIAYYQKQLGKWISGDHDFRGWEGVIDRWLLDDGSTFTRPIIRAQFNPLAYDERPANAIAWNLGDPKGGDMSKWPEDLRIREFPRP